MIIIILFHGKLLGGGRKKIKENLPFFFRQLRPTHVYFIIFVDDRSLDRNYVIMLIIDIYI